MVQSVVNKFIDKYTWIVYVSFFGLLPFSSFYNIPLIILALLGIICLFDKSGIQENQYKIKIYSLLFACIFIPMFFSLPDSINQEETLRKILSFIAYIFTGIAVINGLNNSKYQQYFLLGIGILISVWIVDALFQYVTGSNFLGYPYDASHAKFGAGRLTGIFYPDYRIGIVLAILSPFYFEFVRLCQEKFILAWLMVVPFIFVILLAGSRTSWFMLMLSSILYVFYYLFRGLHKKFRFQALISGVVVIFTLLIVISSSNLYDTSNLKSFFESRISTAQYNPSDKEAPNAVEQRVELWESALRVSRDHWINGIGVRGYRFLDKHEDIDSKPVIISESTRLSTHPHQITLEILLETGIIGLVGYIVFWIILFRISFSLIKSRALSSGLLWIIPIVIAVFPLNMHKSFYEHFSSSIIWMLVALAVANYPSDRIRTSLIK